MFNILNRGLKPLRIEDKYPTMETTIITLIQEVSPKIIKICFSLFIILFLMLIFGPKRTLNTYKHI